MARVLLVDEQPVVRAGLARILAHAEFITQVGEVADVASALTCLAQEHWDLVVLDMTLEESPGADSVRRIVDAFPGSPVLVFSALPESLYARAALRAGGRGFLPKDASEDEIRRAIWTVLSGHRYIADSLASAMACDLEAGFDPSAMPHSRLSAREHEIFLRIAIGESASAIGRELAISVKTVTTYRIRALKKIGIKNNADIIAYASRNGLIDLQTIG